jgi:hypothetical protein
LQNPNFHHLRGHYHIIVAFIDDPDGYRIELVQRPEGSAESP